MADPTQQQQASTTTTPANAAGGAASSGGTVDAGKAPDVASLQKQLADLQAKFDAQGKQLGEVSKEAAERRNAAKQAEDAAKKAAEEKAAAAGDWKTVLAGKDEALAAAAKEREALAAAAKRAEQLEKAFAGEVEALKAGLSDADKALLDGLPAEKQLAFARRMTQVNAGPGAAKPTTAGAPVATAAPQDFSVLSPDDLRKKLAGMSKAELAAAASGGTKSRLASRFTGSTTAPGTAR